MHIINLVVKDGLKSLSNAIYKVQDSVHHLQRTLARKQQFGEAIEMSNITTQAFPTLDVPTNDTFYNLLLQDSKYTDHPKPEEWKEISMMKEFLAIFHSGFFIFLANNDQIFHS